MELFINLNNQRELKKGKKIMRIFSVVTFLLAAATVISLFYETTILSWFYSFYFLLLAVSFYVQSKGGHLFDLIGKSYFKINEEGVECKPDMFKRKIISFNWKDVEFISMKLFEIKVKANNVSETINLEKLTDENLQLVKSIFKNHQKDLVEKDMLFSEF